MGVIPRATLLAPTDGFKMIAPGASVTRCRPDGLLAARTDGDLVGDAVRDLLARDPEADAVVRASVETAGWSIGLYGRQCVTIKGDVVRSVRAILLPMPESHREHSRE